MMFSLVLRVLSPDCSERKSIQWCRYDAIWLVRNQLTDKDAGQVHLGAICEFEDYESIV